MIHTFVGNLGHFLIIASFITALVATYGYVKSVYAVELVDKASWASYARTVFIAHSVFVIGILWIVIVTIFWFYMDWFNFDTGSGIFDPNFIWRY